MSDVKLADKIIALTGDATGKDFAKAMFMLKLPDGVRRTVWPEPLKDWTEMKARANGLWHAEKTKSRSGVYEAAGAHVIANSKVSEQETHAVKVKSRGTRKSKFQEFTGSFYQRANGPCVYHEFFGQSSAKCRSLCSQAGNVRAGRQ